MKRERAAFVVETAASYSSPKPSYLLTMTCMRLVDSMSTADEERGTANS